MNTMQDSELIDLFGGTAATARHCHVTQSAVAQWRVKGIPRDQRVRMAEERPDLFPDEAIMLRGSGRKMARWLRDGR